MKIQLFLLAIGAMSGCATPPPNYTLAEMSDMTTRTYTGKSKAEVFAAAESVFRSVDKKNMEISVFADELKAIRSRLLLPQMIFDWRVKVENLGETTRVFASVVTKVDNAEVHSHNGLGVYQLFFDRLDYFLGIRKDLIDCAKAEAAIREKSRMGNLSALCFLSDDLRAFESKK